MLLVQSNEASYKLIPVCQFMVCDLYDFKLGVASCYRKPTVEGDKPSGHIKSK